MIKRSRLQTESERIYLPRHFSVVISKDQVDDFDTQDITDNALQDLNSALENREAIHHQVGIVHLLGYHLVILSQHGLPLARSAQLWKQLEISLLGEEEGEEEGEV